MATGTWGPVTIQQKLATCKKRLTFLKFKNDVLIRRTLGVQLEMEVKGACMKVNVPLCRTAHEHRSLDGSTSDDKKRWKAKNKHNISKKALQEMLAKTDHFNLSA